MFFMVTDPKTTARTRPRRCAVTTTVALVETGLRLAEVIHAAYYALFIVSRHREEAAREESGADDLRAIRNELTTIREMMAQRDAGG